METWHRGISAAVFALALGACGGGGGGGKNVDTPSGANGQDGRDGLTTLTLVSREEAGPNCAAGGSKISAGLDANVNGMLEADEISSNQYVCNGSGGASGGSGGAAGLVVTTPEPAGANCPEGGSRVSVGSDANGNTILDPEEVSSEAYVCHGETGGNGAPGVPGATGATGTNALVVIRAEPEGANCTYGGSKISSGLDANRNTVLEDAEATVSYICNGTPGPGLTWVTVPKGRGAFQANYDTGYLATSDDETVAIRLPQQPAFGSVVRVSGVGWADWRIEQNHDQSILTHAAMTWSDWLPRETSRNWEAVASSADGNKLVAVVFGGQIYTSTNAGATWTPRESNRNWGAVASSANGTKLVAADYGPVSGPETGSGGKLYTSTDSGVTWTARESPRKWWSVASSADGSKLVALGDSSQIYTSTDSGVNWTARETQRYWSSVASSADGKKLLAANWSKKLYTSVDSGATWTPRGDDGNWWAVASSADGSKLVAAVNGGQLYTSTDSGMTWTARESNRNWSSVALSADGRRLVATVKDGPIYMSENLGVTGTLRGYTLGEPRVASSADGARLLVSEKSGPLYTSVMTPRTQQTTPGVGGSLTGGQHEAIELQYVGDGLFTEISSTGVFEVK